MANTLCITISIAISALFFTSINARVLQANNATTNGNNVTHVCDPDRYKSIGLDMSKFLFCDKSLSFHDRAKDLVNRMTLSEKVKQLGNLAHGVPRIGLPKYEWWSEALHGVSNVGPGTFFDKTIPGATSFPPVILTTASFNETLWKTIGEAVSNEARAMYNMGRAGLTYWSPNVNVVRDPRWGRVTETPGEDPFVVGKYAANYVRGLQDVEGHVTNYTDLNSRPLKVSSCCKHYAAYDLDDWMGVDRFHFSAEVNEQDMVETFLKPFEMCVKEGDVSSIMCSYNRVNGIPTCADPKLLNQTIRTDWDLHGYIVSDCDSIQVMVDDHKFLGDNKEEAVARTLKAGLDLDCGTYYPNFTGNAVALGKVREAEVDKSLKYLYLVLMRLGFFDGHHQYRHLGKKDVCTDANIELAADAARQGITLLKNVNQTLPFNSGDYKTLALVGPHANATHSMLGNYEGVPCRYTSPIEGFSKHAKVNYKMGCGDMKCKNESLIFPAMEAAKKSDATIIFAGTDLSIEAETRDRENLTLPGFQKQLIEQVTRVAKGPVVLVIMSAGCVDINFAKKNSKISAILWAGQPGQEGGRAIADVVYGLYNPGGRLPLTWYEANYIDKVPMTSLPLRPVKSLGYPGRTYKFYNGPTVYPFGYGLSYTNFTYKVVSSKNSLEVKLMKRHHCRELTYTDGAYRPECAAILAEEVEELNPQFDVEIEVENVGKKNGHEVIIVYSKPPEGIVNTYLKQVIGFKRVFVPAGKKEKVKFTFKAAESLKVVDFAANSLVPGGAHTILFGDSGVSAPIQVNFSY